MLVFMEINVKLILVKLFTQIAFFLTLKNHKAYTGNHTDSELFRLLLLTHTYRQHRVKVSGGSVFRLSVGIL